jgi:hypothetical protein
MHEVKRYLPGEPGPPLAPGITPPGRPGIPCGPSRP